MISRIFLVFVSVTCLALSPASAGIFDDRPDIIVCEFPAVADRLGGDVVFYPDASVEGGKLNYKSLGYSPLALSVRADGMIDAGKIESCNGKSVEDLRDAGKAFDFR